MPCQAWIGPAGRRAGVSFHPPCKIFYSSKTAYMQASWRIV
jgi:hypothetical protein